MTVQEFYNVMESDYNEVIGRLMKEERVNKYLHKFAEGDEYAHFKESFEAQDWPEAFRMVHSIKGMCLNLGIRNLSKSSSDLCEEIRNGAPQRDLSDMLAKLDADYNETIAKIKEVPFE